MYDAYAIVWALFILSPPIFGPMKGLCVAKLVWNIEWMCLHCIQSVCRHNVSPDRWENGKFDNFHLQHIRSVFKKIKWVQRKSSWIILFFMRIHKWCQNISFFCVLWSKLYIFFSTKILNRNERWISQSVRLCSR